MAGFHVIGSGYARAQHKVHNSEFEQIVDTSAEWIASRTGINYRYFSSAENTSDLATRASLNALHHAAIDKSKIKYIVVATITPDAFTPSTACIVQDKLGLSGADIVAFDMNAACSGFVFALQVASSLLKEGDIALVIGAETLSKIIDFSDRDTCVLFGDGAGAFLIRSTISAKVAFYLRSLGDSNQYLQAKGISMQSILSNNEKDYSYLKMNGREVFRFAIHAIPDAIYRLCEKEDIDLQTIDLIIPHQANMRIISYVAKKMELPINKFYTNLNEFGNTSAASIPIAFAQCAEEGNIKKGMKILMVGFGGGLTYGASYIEC